MRWAAAVLVLFLTAVCAQAANGKLGHVTGTASYREEIALPPGAVLDVVLEDVSVADAPARELGRATVPEPGSPPFEFDITYDPAEHRARAGDIRVRAQVSVGRRLIFVSDTMNPVLTQGAPDEVDVWMIKVGDTTEEAREAPAAIGAHGLRLPASFAGDLPCANCEKLRYRLNLWPDQVFHLRRSWKGKGVTRDSIGRWSADPDQRMLTLRGGDDEVELTILGPDQLRMKGEDGADYLLTARDEFEAFDLHLPLRGMLTYVADEARFTECLTGRDYPLVRDEGDYEALEHAYLAAGAEAGGAIMASFDGGIVQSPEDEGGGTVPKVLVERFVGIWPGETCERATGEASLTNTYWKILRLDGSEVSASDGEREPSLILREGDPRFTATVGCNQILGSYALDGDKLTLRAGAEHADGLPRALDAWERQLGRTLAGRRRLAHRRADAGAARRRREIPLRSCRRSISTEPGSRAGRERDAWRTTREIGGTGVRVPAIGFGTSGLGHMPDTYGYGVDEARALATVRAVLALPEGFLDSSRLYGMGRSEERIGKVIARARRLAGGAGALDQARPRPRDRAVRRGAGAAVAGGEPGGARGRAGGHPAPARPGTCPEPGRGRAARWRSSSACARRGWRGRWGWRRGGST